MSDGETRPLIGRNSLPWNRRSNTSTSTVSRTSSDLPEHDRSSLSRRFTDRATNPDSKIRPPWKVRGSLVLILLSIIFERLSFYGLAGNLVLFLNSDPYGWESYNAISASFLFSGINFVMSLVGGWISDSLLGRFKAIILAYGIYLCGYLVLPFLAEGKTNNQTINQSLPAICLSSENDPSDDPFKEPCAWLIFITLIVIATGSGILKANICPFGADQLAQASQQTQLSFFNLFYWCVNIGSFLGLGVIAYVEQQQSFQTGFIVCVVTLGSSAIIFIAGRFCYISRPPDGSVLSNIFKILKGAWQNKRQRRFLHDDMVTVPEGIQPRCSETAQEEGKISFLDYAKQCHGGSFHDSLVDDVKKLGTILVVFTVLIPYWLVYFQMQTTFLVQGLHMKLDLSVNWIEESNVESNSSAPEYIIVPIHSKFKFVAAWFSLFDAIAVIILLPLFDRVIYPRMAKAGHPFTFTKRIVLGMLFAMAAMLIAGIVEHFRLKSYWPNDNTCSSRSIKQIIGDTTYYAADMSVLWQIPQYTLIGISEVFASVASLQFAVTFAPKSMKAVVTGLFYFVSGIASFLGIAFVLILASTNTWFQSADSGNINCRVGCPDGNNVSAGSCHLDYYFYSLAGCEVLGLILFLVLSRVFHINSDELVVRLRSRQKTGRRSIQH